MGARRRVKARRRKRRTTQKKTLQDRRLQRTTSRRKQNKKQKANLNLSSRTRWRSDRKRKKKSKKRQPSDNTPHIHTDSPDPPCGKLYTVYLCLHNIYSILCSREDIQLHLCKTCKIIYKSKLRNYISKNGLTAPLS